MLRYLFPIYVLFAIGCLFLYAGASVTGFQALSAEQNIAVEEQGTVFHVPGSDLLGNEGSDKWGTGILAEAKDGEEQEEREEDRNFHDWPEFCGSYPAAFFCAIPLLFFAGNFRGFSSRTSFIFPFPLYIRYQVFRI